mgnify:FL=1
MVENKSFFDKLTPDKIAIAILIISAFLFSILVFFGKGVYGGADNAAHFKYARYAFDNPRFFFNYWAKPGYTSMIAPVAQMGFDAVRVFNVILGIIAAFFTYLIGKRLNYKNAFLLPLLVIFAPGFATSMMSTNTETAFIFITVLSFYFIVKENYKAGIIILSFAFLFRPEAVFFMGVVGLIILFKKKFKLIPWFFTGAIVFFVIASWFYGGMEWLKDFFPYGSPDEYGGGTGDFLHYARKSKLIFGIPHALLLALGVVVVLAGLFWNKIRENQHIIFNKYLLILFSLVGFYLIQSIAIWKGLGTSYGPFRHMVPVIPFSALIALDGYNILYRYIGKYRYIGITLTLVLAYLLIRTPFHIADIPTQLKPDQEAVYKATKWLKTSKYYDNKIYFYNSFFTAFDDDLDPYNPARATFSWGIKDTKKVPEGSIIMWDPHFAPGRGDPLEEFKDNPNFKLLKIIRPEYKFEKNGYPYGIYIFIKQQG